MSGIVRRESALPSVEKARALLAECRLHREVKKIKAAAQAIKTLERGKEIACEAGEIIVEADRRMAELDAEERAARLAQTQKGVSKKGIVHVPLPKSERTQAGRRAPLLTVPAEVDRGVRAAFRKHLVPVTTQAIVSVAKLPEREQKKALACLGDKADVRAAIREAKREVVRTKLEDVGTRKAKATAGVFDVIVIDPPWPMEKIERDERPNQAGFDYPTMSLEQIEALKVPCADDCHVWLWTTQKFLHNAFALLNAWGLKYVCTFVWHKPGGMQVVGLPQYNCEFALYARKGSPTFLDTKAFFTCFEAKRGAHSAKPEEFYDVVRRVTAGRRLDMFNRRTLDGFEGWGKEAAHAAE